MILTLKSVILTSFVKKSTNGVVVLPSFSPLPHFRTKSWSQLHSLMIFMIFNKNRVESDWKTHEDIDTSHIKIINFSIGITKIQKFFRLAAVPLSGVALTTSILRQPDVWGHQNFSKFRKFYFLFLHDLVTHLKKKYVILKEFFHTSNPKIYFFHTSGGNYSYLQTWNSYLEPDTSTGLVQKYTRFWTPPFLLLSWGA